MRVGKRRQRICEMVARTQESEGQTLFQGFFAKLDVGTHIEGHVVVVPDVSRENSGGPHSRGTAVPFKDKEFEEVFSVYASDPALARQVLRQSLRAQLVELAARFGKGVGLTFTGSKAYLLIPQSGKKFEPSLFRPATDLRAIENFAQDLRLALALMTSVGGDGREQNAPE